MKANCTACNVEFSLNDDEELHVKEGWIPVCGTCFVELNFLIDKFLRARPPINVEQAKDWAIKILRVSKR